MLARDLPSSPTPGKHGWAEANTRLFLLTPWMPEAEGASGEREACRQRDLSPGTLIQHVALAPPLSQALEVEASDLAPALKELTVSLAAGVGAQEGEIRRDT